jgi:formiminotetrahydrofolate cyclodeaminase
VELETYLNDLASAAPTPGGGSAATIVGALGSALLAMVARVTLESARLAPVHDAARAVAAQADWLREAFGAARPVDEDAYAAVVAAMALPRATEADKAARTATLQAALAGAAEAPLMVAELCAAAMAVAAAGAALENRNLMSDIECGVRFLRAAFDASAANVRVNHDFLKDAATVEAQRTRLAAARQALARDESAAAEHFAG